MAEVTFYLKGLIDLPEAEELLAPVIGQGMPIACGTQENSSFRQEETHSTFRVRQNAAMRKPLLRSTAVRI